MPARISIGECKGILSIWNDMDVEHQDFYERWYMTEHFPERLGVPGFRRGRRYEAVEADRRYFSFYELDSPDVLFGEAYLARLNAPTAWTQRIMSVWKGMFRTVCERLERRGGALGGYVAVARWEAPVAVEPGIADRIREGLADPSVVAVDVWRACRGRRGDPARQRRQGRQALAGNSERSARTIQHRALSIDCRSGQRPDRCLGYRPLRASPVVRRPRLSDGRVHQPQGRL
jgi:hypothetical protein